MVDRFVCEDLRTLHGPLELPKPSECGAAASPSAGRKTAAAGIFITSMENQLIAVIVRFPSALPTTKSRGPGGHLSACAGPRVREKLQFNFHIYQQRKNGSCATEPLYHGFTLPAPFYAFSLYACADPRCHRGSFIY
ncbi:unnamed protein product [Pleuronectes platessa]|uniref:Uncharacterized protein n=1 Tax=Pleuronectes platessa TaxID=8262 RepID=A0A9N7VU87_PLEPL|nr:unnamed protein product [Pleuronectes platessa]